MLPGWHRVLHGTSTLHEDQVVVRRKPDPCSGNVLPKGYKGRQVRPSGTARRGVPIPEAVPPDHAIDELNQAGVIGYCPADHKRVVIGLNLGRSGNCKVTEVVRSPARRAAEHDELVRLGGRSRLQYLGLVQRAVAGESRPTVPGPCLRVDYVRSKQNRFPCYLHW